MGDLRVIHREYMFRDIAGYVISFFQPLPQQRFHGLGAGFVPDENDEGEPGCVENGS
jgi:hypothetical protein